MTFISINHKHDPNEPVIGQKLIDLSKPSVMGILNITPDSFFSGSRFTPNSNQIIYQVSKMINDGATFIDIGGYSTRPDADDVSVSKEIDRVTPVIEVIAQNFGDKVAISIDTFRSKVAREAVNVGATIINDIAGGNLDEEMFQTVAELQVPYILMHSRGNPQTMNKLNDYQNLTLDVITELQEKVAKLRALAVKDIIIDPGFGFAKNAKQGFEMMRNLEAFKVMDLPLLVGVSRKSMIWRTLNITADEALNGTTVLNMYALMQGAKILRVHDVKEASQTIRLFEELGKVRMMY
ncbi:dihydropteroate synthase [Emticicia aquatilis]|uniref:dihydropteroate synthase n=1 Tax=Emticicia aquatilis TaxID=1537369 RepID=A0A916YST5_9BACT|nr:dihydropteroate synthase [Emticicia aquatilis]GGD58297.1 dihydropteroate synthase [Emticicia aquatilis]